MQSIDKMYSSSRCRQALDLAGHPKEAPFVDPNSGRIGTKSPTSVAQQLVYRTRRDDQYQVLPKFEVDSNDKCGNSDDGDSGPAKRAMRGTALIFFGRWCQVQFLQQQH